MSYHALQLVVPSRPLFAFQLTPEYRACRERRASWGERAVGSPSARAELPPTGRPRRLRVRRIRAGLRLAPPARSSHAAARACPCARGAPSCSSLHLSSPWRRPSSSRARRPTSAPPRPAARLSSPAHALWRLQHRTWTPSISTSSSSAGRTSGSQSRKSSSRSTSRRGSRSSSATSTLPTCASSSLSTMHKEES